MLNLKRLLEGAQQVGASDLHLKVGRQPLLRVNTRLTPVKQEPLQKEEVQDAVETILPSRLKETFAREGAADFAHHEPGVGRFRVAAFHQRGNMGLVFRVIDATPPPLEDLGLPPAVQGLPKLSYGLILVTGITGSGKSTTLASLIHYMNQNRRMHIVTIEDPIEYMFEDKQSVINQLEIGEDCPSFAVAMKRILRFDPDAIMIGEMRDRETVMTGIEAVDTGHLVLSTLHTSDAKQTINRFLHFFDKREEQMILELLSLNLKAIISQRLLARAENKGLVPAVELLINTPIISKLIFEGRVEEMQQALQNGDKGMQTFDMGLAQMVRAKVIDLEIALAQAADEAALRRMIRGEFSAGDRAGLVG